MTDADWRRRLSSDGSRSIRAARTAWTAQDRVSLVVVAISATDNEAELINWVEDVTSPSELESRSRLPMIANRSSTSHTFASGAVDLLEPESGRRQAPSVPSSTAMSDPD